MRGWMGLCLGFVAACGGSMGPQQAVAFPEFHRRLTNGITLIVLPDATTSLVEVDVRYDVGSREDPPGKAGLAHLVEHRNAETSRRFPPNRRSPGIGTKWCTPPLSRCAPAPPSSRICSASRLTFASCPSAVRRIESVYRSGQSTVDSRQSTEKP